MLEILKKQNPFTLLFVIVYGFVIRSSIFFIDTSNIVFDKTQAFSFLTDKWCFVSSQNLILHYIITTSILIVLSIFINVYLRDNKIIDKLGYLPTLFFLLISACFSSFLYVSNEFIAFVFFSIGLIRLLQALLIEETTVSVFDASFFMSVSSLFYKPLLLCFVIVLLAVLILKNVNIKSLVFLILGLIIPYFLLGVYMFFTDRLSLFFTNITPQLFSSLQLFAQKDYLQVIKIVFIGILTGMGFLQIQTQLSKSIVNIRKYYSMLLIVCLVFVPLFLINKQMTTQHFMFLILPVSYYILNFLKDMKRVWLSELIHVALFALIYLSNI